MATDDSDALKSERPMPDRTIEGAEDTASFKNHSLTIQDLYHEAFISTTKLVTSNTCVKCREVSSSSIIQHCLSQLVLWSDGLDLQWFERAGDWGTGLQLTVIRKLSKIISLGHSILHDCSKKEVSRPDIIALIRNYYNSNIDAESDVDSSESSDSDDNGAEFPRPRLNIHQSHLQHINWLRMHVTSLLNLLPTLQSCSNNPADLLHVARSEVVVSETHLKSVFEPFIMQIQDKFRDIDTEFASRLGEANWNRFQRLKTLDTTGDDEEPVAITGQESIGQPALLDEDAFYIVSRFHDSGLGSSLPARSKYTATIASHRSMLSTTSASARGAIRVPPIPWQVHESIPFTCEVCGRKQSHIRNRVDWKRHVFHDLQPYLCIYESCTKAKMTFATRNQWVDHITKDHSEGEHAFARSRQRPIYLDTLRSVEQLQPPYVSTQIPIVPVTSLQHATCTKTPKSSQMNSFSVCPFCFRKDIGTQHAWTTHICRHFEEIALIVLPRCYEESEDDNIDNNEQDFKNERSHSATNKNLELQDHDLQTSTAPVDNEETKGIISLSDAMPALDVSRSAEPWYRDCFSKLLPYSEPPLSDFMTNLASLAGSTISSNEYNHSAAYGPTRQSPQFEGDIYTPPYKRTNAAGKWEGWCGFCKPGRWLDLKNSRYWEDKLRNHGISARTKTFFDAPLRMRWIGDTGTVDDVTIVDEEQPRDSSFIVSNEGGDISKDIFTAKREGLCGECNTWVQMDGMRSNGRGRYVAWWIHAYRCHEQSNSHTEGVLYTLQIPTEHHTTSLRY